MRKGILRAAVTTSAILMVLLLSVQAEAGSGAFPMNGGDLCFVDANRPTSFLVLSMRPASENLYYVVGQGLTFSVALNVNHGACRVLHGGATIEIESQFVKANISIPDVGAPEITANMLYFTIDSAGTYQGPYAKTLVSAECPKLNAKPNDCLGCHTSETP